MVHIRVLQTHSTEPLLWTNKDGAEPEEPWNRAETVSLVMGEQEKQGRVLVDTDWGVRG